MKPFINLILTLIIITSTACESQVPTSFQSSFSSCLTSEETKLLALLCSNFEEHIKKTYQKDLVGAYQQYLDEVGRLGMPSNPPNFFNYPSLKTDLLALQGSSLFTKTWMNYERFQEIRTEEDSVLIPPVVLDGKVIVEEKPKYDLFVFNPNGEMVACFAKNSKNEMIQTVISALKNWSDISPIMVARGLSSSLTKDEYKNEFIRAFIAMYFHYQMCITITQKE